MGYLVAAGFLLVISMVMGVIGFVRGATEAAIGGTLPHSPYSI